MSKLPTVTGREAIRAFQGYGFSVARIKGSHHIMKKEGHRYRLSVVVHGNKNLKPGTLSDLIKAAGLTVDEFIALL